MPIFKYSQCVYCNKPFKYKMGEQSNCPLCNKNTCHTTTKIPLLKAKTRNKISISLKPLMLIFSLFSVATLFVFSTSTQSNNIHNDDEVTLYSTSWCGYCRKTKTFFHRYNIPYTEKNIEESYANKKAFKQLGGKGVPLIIIGNKKIHGYNPKRLKNALKNAGYPFY